MRVKTPSQMSIKKTGIARWRGSGFLWRTLKKEQELFCTSLFFSRDIAPLSLLKTYAQIYRHILYSYGDLGCVKSPQAPPSLH